MPHIATFDVHRSTDGAVVDAWQELRKLSGAVPGELIKAAPLLNLKSFENAPAEGWNINSEPLKPVLDVSGLFFRHFDLPLGNGIHLKYRRRIGVNEGETKTTDAVEVHAESTVDPATCALVLQRSRILFRAIDSLVDPSADNTIELAHLEQRRGEIDQLIEIRRGFFSDLRAHESQLRATLQAEREQLKNEFNEERRKAQEQTQAERDAVGAARTLLDEERKKYETREPKFVRRQQRDTFLTEIRDRRQDFRLSSDTRWRMLGVVSGYIALLGVLLSAAAGWLPSTFDAATVGQLLDNPAQNTTTSPLIDSNIFWIRAGRQSLFMIGFVVTAGFFIRWLNKWFRDHADAEFRFIKYGDDFERANWLVEIATEWAEDRRETIPEYVIERLSRNLFYDERVEETATTAMDAVLKALKGGKLKVGEVEVDVGRTRRKASSAPK